MLTQGHENGGALESCTIIHLRLKYFQTFPQVEHLVENVIHLKILLFTFAGKRCSATRSSNSTVRNGGKLAVKMHS